jgi:Fur family ferric uptake transcriptional regulator
MAAGASGSWAQHAAGELAHAGYRRGGARSLVIELLDEQECARSAVEIEDELRRRNRAVARASVYRILDQLDRLGLVQRVETGQSMIRYEPVREGRGHHHHLVCDSCGSVTPFADEELERAIVRLTGRVPLEVSEHEIVLHGSCPSCAD